MIHQLLICGPAEFETKYCELLEVCPDASVSVADAIISRRPEMSKEKKGLMAKCTAHATAHPAPDWLLSLGFFSQAMLPLHLGVVDMDGCTIS
mmetsp:Transcript_28210/g.42578  ORF Transcript_28210/g.42578 Transcript_28210/m.42578 type:complete len:93 (-) Transcript_28210:192-470(-)